MKKISSMSPRMVESSIIKPRLRSELDKEEMDMIESMRPKKHEGMSEDKAPAKEEFMSNKMAEGGEVKGSRDESSMEEMDHQDSIASAIMAKRKRMASGGMVDIDSNEEEQHGIYEDRNEEILKENYDEDIDSINNPSDSAQHGDSIDSDRHDMIKRIRSKMRSKV